MLLCKSHARRDDGARAWLSHRIDASASCFGALVRQVG